MHGLIYRCAAFVVTSWMLVSYGAENGAGAETTHRPGSVQSDHCSHILAWSYTPKLQKDFHPYYALLYHPLRYTLSYDMFVRLYVEIIVDYLHIHADKQWDN